MCDADVCRSRPVSVLVSVLVFRVATSRELVLCAHTRTKGSTVMSDALPVGGVNANLQPPWATHHDAGCPCGLANGWDRATQA